MDNETRYKIIMLSDMLIDDYNLQPGMTLNLEAQIGDRHIKVAVTFKEGEQNDN